MPLTMEVATISANGQITLPADVRKRLHVGPGDKVAFVENEAGEVVVVRANVAALLKAQRAFQGVMQEAGLETEEDLDAYVAKVRTDLSGRIPE